MSGTKTFLLLILLSLAVRVGIAVTYRFEGVYGQDPFMYINIAENLAAHGDNVETSRTSPPVRRASPMGYPLVVAGLYKIFGVHDIMAQSVSIVLGALTAGLAFLFFNELFALYNIVPAKTSALIASLFIALSPEHIRLSLVCLADATGLFFIVASMLSAVKIARRQSNMRMSIIQGALLGVCFAFAVMSRFGNIIIAVPLLWLIFSFRRPRTLFSAGTAAICAGALCITPQIISFFHVTAEWHYEGYLKGVSVLNLFKTEFRNLNENDVEFVKIPNVLYYAALGFGGGFATPAGALAAVYGFLRIRKNKLIVFCAVWYAVVWLMICILPFQNGRFLMPAYPPICILAGIGAAAFFSYVRSRVKAFNPGILFTMLFILALGASISLAETRIKKLSDYENEERTLVKWANDCAGKNALLLSCNVGGALSHFTELNNYDLYWTDTTQLDTLVKTPEKYYIIDSADIAQRWQGFRVNDNIAWIQRHFTPQPEFFSPHYTIFKF